MRTFLAALAGLLLFASTAAHAQEFERTITYSLPAGRTFAVRALCLEFGQTLHAHPAGNWAAGLGSGGDNCVNGRTGLTFTVPPGAAMQLIQLVIGWDSPARPDLKIRLDPDCRGDVLTTCALKVARDPRGRAVGTASGRFTWPGDEDWYRLDRISTHLDTFRTTTLKDTCVAIGKVVRTADDTLYLVLSGGPAGCVYTVTGASSRRPRVSYRSRPDGCRRSAPLQ